VRTAWMMNDMSANAATYDPFESDWRACLEAHLRFVVSTGDTINEHSLIDVLKTAGMTDDDIARVRYEIRGDQLPDEATEQLETEIVELVKPVPEPIGLDPVAEVQVVDIPDVETALVPVDAPPVEAVLDPEPIAELNAGAEEHPLPDAAQEDATTPPPMQLSLF
jgi:hypothetical protein